MNRITDIEQLKAGEFALRSNGLKAKPTPVYVIKIEVGCTYAKVCWAWLYLIVCIKLQ